MLVPVRLFNFMRFRTECRHRRLDVANLRSSVRFRFRNRVSVFTLDDISRLHRQIIVLQKYGSGSLIGFATGNPVVYGNRTDLTLLNNEYVCHTIWRSIFR